MQERISINILDSDGVSCAFPRSEEANSSTRISRMLAPVLSISSIILITEGFTRKDWNQVAIGVSMGILSVGLDHRFGEKNDGVLENVIYPDQDIN